MTRLIYFRLFVLICIITNTSPDCFARNPLFEHAKSDTVKIFNIKDYGAVGNGKTIDTESINKAISACSDRGGGTVLVPEGKFVTGTVLLKSNVTLHLERNSILLGTDDISQYKYYNIRKNNSERPLHLPLHNNSVWSRALVLLDQVRNVTITGSGRIDGNTIVDKQGEEGWRGPHGILIGESQNIEISGITISRSGNYNILGADIEEVELTNLFISEGSDGIHIREGKNIRIENCKIFTSDDAIAGGYWENMLITGCIINSSCNGIRLILPATNLEIMDCEIFGPGIFGHRRGSLNNPLVTNSLTGIIMQPGAWGLGPGSLDKIFIHDVRIRDMQTALTIVLNEGNHAGSIDIENITATGIYRNACSVEAWAEGSKFENIKIKNVSVTYHVDDEQVLGTTGFFRPRTESRALPYWGFYARNVDNIVFENVTFDYLGNKEIRPAMGFEKVNEVILDDVKYRTVSGIDPLKHSQNTTIKKYSLKPIN
ncbi:MAG: glycosyl hydrolase family 28-related protein [Proteiniphilum sp.]|uniref:glycoside hydrolase family 28 protein n=1 Tax=Proteiniphilum sp. TaxID=1926877 RepID=UPI002ABCF994|nr:glycosyl hydrolase family 28-related protein [Proteiniphilum sp.]MDY9919045.1 glycosyl hydrolase family 28-related protein [Proteiniphilum sp.]